MYEGGEIDSKVILKLKSTLDAENEYKLGTIRSLLRNWIEWKHPGIESDLSETLDRLVLKGNIKGKSVLHQCPYTGAYTLTEQQSLLIWAGNAFQKSIISLEEFAWFYTVYATARRPTQIRALRVCDLEIKTINQKIVYSLNIPRAKQRYGGFRSEFRSLTITEDLYLIIKSQIEEVKEFALSVFKEISSPIFEQLPIFPNYELFDEDKIQGFDEIIGDTPDYFHITINKAYTLSRNLSCKCDAISERTGDYIHFTPVRCRRTRATNLVRNGITGVQLAYLLTYLIIQILSNYLYTLSIQVS